MYNVNIKPPKLLVLTGFTICWALYENIQRILTKPPPLLDSISATESWTQQNFPREKGKRSEPTGIQKASW